MEKGHEEHEEHEEQHQKHRSALRALKNYCFWPSMHGHFLRLFVHRAKYNNKEDDQSIRGGTIKNLPNFSLN